jgi:hypothetical protein
MCVYFVLFLIPQKKKPLNLFIYFYRRHRQEKNTEDIGVWGAQPPISSVFF